MVSKLERLAAASEEFKSAVIKDEKGNESDSVRYIRLKTKNSSSENTVTNSVTVRDQVADAKYVVSVSAVMSGKNPSAETLLALQLRITDFLNTIHEGL